MVKVVYRLKAIEAPEVQNVTVCDWGLLQSVGYVCLHFNGHASLSHEGIESVDSSIILHPTQKQHEHEHISPAAFDIHNNAMQTKVKKIVCVNCIVLW